MRHSKIILTNGIVKKRGKHLRAKLRLQCIQILPNFEYIQETYGPRQTEEIKKIKKASNQKTNITCVINTNAAYTCVKTNLQRRRQRK